VTSPAGALPAGGGRGAGTVVAVVTAALFTEAFLYGLVLALAPSLVPAREPGRLGLLGAGYAAGLLGATPFCGWLGHRLGGRNLMLGGFALMATAIALLGLGGPFGTQLAGRTFQGAAAAASWTGGLALVAEHGPDRRVKLIGYVMTGSTAGSVAGPALGGWLHAAGGPGLAWLVAGTLAAADGCLRWRFLPPGEPDRPDRPAFGALLDRPVLGAALAVALAAGAWGLVEPILPTHLAHTVGASPLQVGTLFAGATLVYGLVSPAVDRVCARLDLRRTIGLGLAGMAASLTLLLAARSLLQTSALLCLASAAFALAHNPASAELGEAVDRSGRGTYAGVFALYNAAYSVGMMGAGLIAALAPEPCSLPAHFLMMRPALPPVLHAPSRPASLFRPPGGSPPGRVPARVVVHRPGPAGPGAGADLPAHLAVPWLGRTAGADRRLPGRGGRGRPGGGGARPAEARGLRQRLPAPPP